MCSCGGNCCGKSVVMVSAGIVAAGKRKANRIREAFGMAPYGTSYKYNSDQIYKGKSVVMITAGIVAASKRKANKIRKEYGLPAYVD